MLKCRNLLLDKKGENIVILDLQGLSTITDYFLICTGTSRKHVQTLAEHTRLSLKKLNVNAHHIEGYNEGAWVVLDYINAIIHIFDDRTRNYYLLEKLWGDAKKI